MGKRFERPEDISRENKAATLLVGDTDKYVLEKLDPNDLDFYIRDKETNKVVAVVEIKGVKKVPSVDSEHTPVIALQKLLSLQEYHNIKRVPNAYIVWAYGDGIKYTELKSLKGTLAWGGRRKRAGSTNDQELLFTATGTNFKIKKYEREHVGTDE